MVRRLLDRLLRVAEWFAASLMLWVPLLLILAASIVYLYRVYAVGSAPGVPIALTYEGANGTFHLSAQSYAIYAENHLAQLTGIRLTDDKNREIASLRTLRVSYDGHAVTATAHDGILTARRGTSGAIDALNALPKQKEGGESMPVTVHVGRVKLLYEDQSEAPNLRAVAVVRQAVVAASNGNATFRGKLALQSQPEIEASGTLSSDGTGIIHAQIPSGEYAFVLPHVVRWLPRADRPTLADLALNTAQISGTTTVLLLPKKPITFLADATVDAAGVKYSDILRGATVQGTVHLVEDALSADVVSKESGREAIFKGTLDWKNEVALHGRFKAAAANQRALWTPLAKILPKELAAQGLSMDGSLAWSGKAYSIGGRIAARTLGYQGQIVDQVRATALFNESGLRLKTSSARFAGTPLEGGLALDYASGRLVGSARTTGEAQLGSLAKKIGAEQFDGRGRLQAVVESGKRGLSASLSLVGHGQVALGEGERVRLDQILGFAEFKEGVWRVRQASATSGQAVIAATGQYQPSADRLNFDVSAVGIPIERWVDQASGVASFSGTISGKPQSPEIQGKAQAISIHIADFKIPAVLADVRLKNRQLSVENAQADAGMAVLGGNISLNLDSKRLSGVIRSGDLQLADWIDDSPIAGVIKSTQATISGTLDNPVLEADLATDKLGSERYVVQRASGHVRLDRESLTAAGVQFGFSTGKAALDGKYSFKDGKWSGSASVDQVPIEALISSAEFQDTSGLISGKFAAQGNHEVVDAAKVALSLQNTRIVGVDLGGGTVDASAEKGAWIGHASVGGLDRYVLVDQFKYNQNTDDLSGTVDLLRLPLGGFVNDALRQKLNLDPEWTPTFDQSFANLTASISLSGNAKSPTAIINDAAIDDIVVNGRSGGSVRAKAQFDESGFALRQFMWTIPQPPGQETAPVTYLRAQGTASKDGNLDFSDVRLGDFDLSWLHTLRPDWPLIPVLVSSTLDVGGRTSQPTARGSLAAIVYGESTDVNNPELPTVNLDDVRYDGRTIFATGRAVYGAFGGSIDAQIPLAALRKDDPNAAEMNVSVKIDSRNLKEFKEMIAGLDSDRVTGTVDGSALIRGNAFNFALEGGIHIRDATIAAKGVETALTGISADLDLISDAARLKVLAQSSAGGQLNLQAQARIPSLFVKDFDLDSYLRESVLSGSLAIKDFWVKEKPSSRDQHQIGRISDANLTFGGNLLEPEIGGNIVVADADVTVPQTESAGAELEAFINPIFQKITLNLANPALVRTSTADIALRGGGELGGTLNQPRAQARFRVVQGRLALPTALIVLEEDGVIDFIYDGLLGANEPARLNLAMVGRTQITARQFTQSPERYDVTIQINGDLLSREGLILNPTSDPPDLSPDEILSILGQRDLIQQFAKGATTRGNNGLTDAALSLAVPTLTDAFTLPLARSFKLDYLNLSYTPFDGTILTASKTLAKGLTATLRRQLVQSVNQKLRYDFKLTYRIPSRDRLVSRLRFSYGFDQRTPWRLGVDYYTRF